MVGGARIRTQVANSWPSVSGGFILSGHRIRIGIRHNELASFTMSATLRLLLASMPCSNQGRPTAKIQRPLEAQDLKGPADSSLEQDQRPDAEHPWPA